MTDIIFSSWQNERFDGREAAAPDNKPPANVKLAAEFRPGERIKALMGWDGIVLRDDDVDIVDMCAKYAEAVQQESCGKCFPLPRRDKDRRRLAEEDRRRRGKGGVPGENQGSVPLHPRRIQVLHRSDGDEPHPRRTAPFPAGLCRSNHGTEKGQRRPLPLLRHRPCVSVCPSSLDIPRYVEEISEQRFAESLATIRQGVCMAGTLGRVCIRPCESNCRRANIDEAISIKWLKRYVADYEIEKNRHPEIRGHQHKDNKKVAVIGAGPAGLSCAYYLSLMGYRVTIFEKLPEPGGMAAVGIPDYRLPRAIIRSEVEIVKETGVEIRYGVEIGKEIKFADIRKDHDAVFIGVGAQGSSPMGVEGEEKNYRGFISGVQYLLDINLGRDPYPEGKKWWSSAAATWRSTACAPPSASGNRM